jgi:CHAT domain-containing protein
VSLIHGDVDGALSLLRDAAAESDSPLHWSDLSAAYLVKADRTPARRIEYLARGFDAASRSLRLQGTPEALFNRTLALEGLSRYVAEPAPWAEYLRLESDQQWLAAANRFMAAQQPFEDAAVRWAARRRDLRTHLANRDVAFVRDTVSEFPEASREHFEEELLLGWAESRQRGDDAAAARVIEEARLLTNELAQFTGDRMTADEVEVLGAASETVARGYRAYISGVGLYESNKYQQARAAFVQAHADFAGNPYRYWALARRATVDFLLRDVAASESALVEVETYARAHRYRSLLAWTLWVRGLIFLQQWRLSEALAAFEQGARDSEATRQRELAVSLYHLLANNLRTLGEQQRSWEYIGKTLEGLTIVRKPVRRYISFYNATLFATSQGLTEAALVFQNAAVREATKATPEVKIDALTQRAGVHLRRGDRTTAARDLTEAADLLANVSEGSLQRYLKADIDVLYAQLHIGDKPGEAAARVHDAIRFFDKVEPARIPRLYLDLARSHLAGNHTTEAAAAMTQGIERLEAQQAGLQEEALKISYFDESWALFDEMVALQLTRMGDKAAAFDFAERSRARSLLAASERTDAPRPLTLPALHRAIPADAQLVYYYVLPQKLLVWLIDSSGSRLIEQPLDAGRLTRHAAQFRDGASAGDVRRAVNDELYDVLWTPVRRSNDGTKTVVIVADGELQQVPFAALRNPETGRYVVEDYTLVQAPSASFFVTTAERAATLPPGASSALLIGNPTTADGTPLPAAEREAAQAAQFYPEREILIGAMATKAAFIDRAPRYDVVHFGGHALPNPEYPLLSRLMLASEREDDALFAHEISRLRFSRTRLVILAACSTARGAVSRGEGPLSVARPFLAGGVPVVIASQWDVDDRATAELFLAFHREFAVSKNPANALRKAQLELLRNAESVFSSPASWGAFVALGATTR